MNDDYSLRRAETGSDGSRLREFYRSVFDEEDVGQLAKVMLEHLPGLKPDNWFIIESAQLNEIAAALALIPWRLNFCGVELKTAEMGIVGTAKDHRNHGLQRRLNDAFDGDLESDKYDIAMIQGIPGFYYQFGYQYAVPLENHINVPLHAIGKSAMTCDIRKARIDEITCLAESDEAYRDAFDISTIRSNDDWKYLLTDSAKTSYGSDFYVIESASGQRSYMRIPAEGFGSGLIVSEMSEGILYDEFLSAMAFCRERAETEKKPYIRLNVHNESTAAKMAYTLGVAPGESYSLQIKIPDRVRFLNTIRPVLDRRLKNSFMRNFSGVFEVNLYKQRIYMTIDSGEVTSITKTDEAADGKVDYSCRIRDVYFEAIVLGHRSIDEIRHVSPDTGCGGASKALTEILFPRMKSWIHERY